MATPKFANIKGSQFHQELKRRVQQYFQEKKKPMSGNATLYTKAIILFLIYFALYVHLVFFTPPTWLAIIECILMGGATAAIGFNVMHDGSHGSFSNSKMANKLAAFSANILGASGIMWNNKHNIIHHTYTNIDGVDDDIEIKPLLRMCSTQKKRWIHQFQHIYVWFLYTLLLLVWLFVSDYTKYFRQKIGDLPLKKMSVRDHIAFWVAKVGYAMMMIVIPIYMVGFVSWLVGFLVMTLFSGFVLSIVFQLAHTVEVTEFPTPAEDTNKLEAEWAVHQVQTTANFATRNKLYTWLLGGLNFQIEHHLFPKISHVHYPAISKIIKQTCQEFGIPYHEYPKMRQAIASHTNYLKKMGRE
ncbi:MAG TPA: acyl-CoA desaturase [Ferruginibacter sp.]|nr:acyl-CoA desaturase [Ferruginibacter sp.]HRO05218.1 acyl-CoA desaturase [Ferruginibacter sp.]HRO95980.1 acyl-CoA desaturase [Ferruginibacter sp.]HRP48684.1 acyl-CoA desaturase [Ferruginibacter sp.]